MLALNLSMPQSCKKFEPYEIILMNQSGLSIDRMAGTFPQNSKEFPVRCASAYCDCCYKKTSNNDAINCNDFHYYYCYCDLKWLPGSTHVLTVRIYCFYNESWIDLCDFLAWMDLLPWKEWRLGIWPSQRKAGNSWARNWYLIFSKESREMLSQDLVFHPLKRKPGIPEPGLGI